MYYTVKNSDYGIVDPDVFVSMLERRTEHHGFFTFTSNIDGRAKAVELKNINENSLHFLFMNIDGYAVMYALKHLGVIHLYFMEEPFYDEEKFEGMAISMMDGGDVTPEILRTVHDFTNL